uniref:Uncharacterized protein n=1 Tax=viral metagenome TaxID=1070528 RepID=A0A6M3LC26_9ZZZZ
MRVESIRIKVLRQGERYTNDETSLQVQLEEGDDWEAIERDLRARAVALIAEHWELREAEERSEREYLQKKRNEYVARRLEEGREPCDGCLDEYPCRECPCPPEKRKYDDDGWEV